MNPYTMTLFHHIQYYSMTFTSHYTITIFSMTYDTRTYFFFVTVIIKCTSVLNYIKYIVFIHIYTLHVHIYIYIMYNIK